MVHLSFAGHALHALPEGALFWPERRALLIADLHLEKASWFARHGQLLPPYDSLATLERLAGLIERMEPAEVWCLGDSFHDDAGPLRLTARAQALLDAMMDRVAWHWITGNHDLDAAEPGAGARLDEACIDGVWLRHEAVPADPRPEISGHFHPKARLLLRGRHVSRRCFVASATKLILPAFGALAGGLDASHPAIHAALGSPGEAIIALKDRLLRLPLVA